ncbi:crossover junction endodeoxyribonuclease RuvC [Thermosulfurimonas dismutans]|uniref:Crossover junction endodeoxyribonuclease RuvC n=1 Tax=Thermosulfurimonas dismutans TaxID=999894 RepID=A0A179D675_9BACT|nr:crossover junction endodeoxyribonuclease RuvC [Thermosulfurimonas dismutans]OAQ21594.1 Crossover junction endodeoxyribonuclease RuvC [Thermosulfurimonas dismutans]
MRILGLDPGSRVTGYGLIEGQNPPRALAWGVIKLGNRNGLPERLYRLYQELGKILREFQPEVIALEEVIPERYPRAALSLGQSQGIILLLVGQTGLPLFTYHPLEVKTELTGNGRAGKEQVSYMVKQTLEIEEPLETDAADALALALTHFYRINRAF